MMNERYMVNKTDNFRRITACLCVVIFVWLYVVITTRFIYSYLTVCCYNNEIKYAARVGVIFGFGVWVLYFIDTALLLVIHISLTQKWARGFTEPSRYFAFANGYNCGIYRCGECCMLYFWRDIILTQRCWWGCIFYVQHIWRRNVMRRYVQEDTQ